MNVIGARGAHRTALEFSKLILSLEPDSDPVRQFYIYISKRAVLTSTPSDISLTASIQESDFLYSWACFWLWTSMLYEQQNINGWFNSSNRKSPPRTCPNYRIGPTVLLWRTSTLAWAVIMTKPVRRLTSGSKSPSSCFLAFWFLCSTNAPSNLIESEDTAITLRHNSGKLFMRCKL